VTPLLTVKRLRSLAARVRRRVEKTLLPLGNRVECPYCGWTGLRFLSAGALGAANRLCPGCGSLERYRMLPPLIARELPGRSLDILELAPKECFTSYCRRQSGWRYVSSDLSSPAAMVLGDLRSMPFKSESFDLIVNFHVMEHIVEDVVAFREIGRLLKRDGLGVICVPIQGATTREGAPESEWERLYGQVDHVRYYGLDIEERMRSAGLVIQRIDTREYFPAAELTRYALRGDDRYLFLVRKPTSA
jgi:SAM-dependent methyltransferase